MSDARNGLRSDQQIERALTLLDMILAAAMNLADRSVEVLERLSQPPVLRVYELEDLIVGQQEGRAKLEGYRRDLAPLLQDLRQHQLTIARRNTSSTTH